MINEFLLEMVTSVQKISVRMTTTNFNHSLILFFNLLIDYRL